MISTTPKPGDRLRAHANDLKSGRMRWFRYPPSRPGEAYMVWRWDMGSSACRRVLETDAEESALRLALHLGSHDYLGAWNDEHTLPEVISALEAAADLLDKEGE